MSLTLAHALARHRLDITRRVATSFPNAGWQRAEDATSQAVLQLYTRSEQYEALAVDDPVGFVRLFYTVAWRSARADHRSAFRKKGVAMDGLPEMEETRRPDDNLNLLALLDHAILPAMHAAVAQYGGRRKAALFDALLDYFSSASTGTEIAERHGVHRTQVSRALSFVRARLRDLEDA